MKIGGIDNLMPLGSGFSALIDALVSVVTGPAGPSGTTGPAGSTVTGPAGSSITGASGATGPAWSFKTIAALGAQSNISDGGFNVTVSASVATINIRSGNTTWYWKMSSSTNK